MAKPLRMFDAVQYRLYDEVRHKRKAQDVAKALRKRGWHTRVVSSNGWWAIYRGPAIKKK